jgi:signal peptidase I
VLTGTMQEACLREACCDLVTDIARASGKVQLKVTGTSMVPALWPGDLLTVRSCSPYELAPGSIIVFRQDQQLIVHRLMHRLGDQIVTRGDARPRLDKAVESSQIVGRVEIVMRNGRPVGLRDSLVRQFVAVCLRRSEWCTWFFLRASSKIRKMEFVGAAFGQ